MHAIKPGTTVCCEMMFDLKSYFHYRAPVKGFECFALRKTNWRRLQLIKLNNKDGQMTWNHILMKYKQQ